MRRDELVFSKDGLNYYGYYEMYALANGSCRLAIVLPEAKLKLVKEGENYFDILRFLRNEVNSYGFDLLCNGTSIDVYPSAMQLDMGNGEKAYRMREGFHATLNDVVNIFEFDEKEFVFGTVQDQEEYFNTWRSSKKRRRYSKPKYNIESIDPRSPCIYFWGHQPAKDGSIGKSCLSQWWPCVFEKDGVKYSSAEQWMMAEKARAFLDTDILSKILKSESPKEAKDLGRQVNNFSEDVWKLKSYSIVLEGNLLKFDQNPELKEYLLGTGDSIFVEASPYDKIWGVGMSQDDEGIDNPQNWRGKNLLGFALMEVRDLLNEENEK